ncbi:hypothetical protein ACFVW2_01730 [Streptomyces sp. NPDC058171]
MSFSHSFQRLDATKLRASTMLGLENSHQYFNRRSLRASRTVISDQGSDV